MMARGAMRDFAEPLVPELPRGPLRRRRRPGREDLRAHRRGGARGGADRLRHGACPPAGYFDEVRRLCDRTGAKLIIDEVVCGMGRLGPLWGCQYWDVEPDMLVPARASPAASTRCRRVVTRPECLDFFG